MPPLRDLNHNLFNQFERALISARQGSVVDMGALLDFYRGYLLTFAEKKLSRQLAIKIAPSDLVQETLIKASQEFHDFHGVSEQELRTWLKRILARKLIDSYRYFQKSSAREISREAPKWPEELLLAPSTASDSYVNCHEKRVEVLTMILGRLDDVQQRAIRLRTFDRCTFEEVGQQLGRSAEAARKIWTRAIRRLTQEFRRHEFRTRAGT